MPKFYEGIILLVVIILWHYFSNFKICIFFTVHLRILYVQFNIKFTDSSDDDYINPSQNVPKKRKIECIEGETTEENFLQLTQDVNWSDGK